MLRQIFDTAHLGWPPLVVTTNIQLFGQTEDQAIDRAHRIGQEHDVTVHKLYMAGEGLGI